MNEESLVNRRIADWKRLEELCAKSDLRVGSLSNYEILEFVRLYKRASTDLSLIRTRSANEPLAMYLNNVVSRAHGILYKSPTKPLRKAISDMLNNTARTFRRNKWFFWASFSIFFGSSFFAFFLVHRDHSFLSYFTGGMDDVFDQWKKGTHDQRSLGESGMMTFFYAGNNPRVSIIAGAVGAGTMGLLSIMMLFQNGAILGALASEMYSVHKLPFLISSIAPHGVPELSGVMFAGAAGLRFGWAILVPGVYSRAESLRRSAKDGVTMIVTGVFLCFIAAPIEGFFSFSPHIPQEAKFIFACFSLVVWIYFWSFFGKDSEEGLEST
ncbi:MAG: stage II sporulation protein M [Armatimonadetes bacterium]|nr:hypothetical protein [Armatimonadota bacterium]MBS1702783.1 stage II sporulation protein M [Armatimonadota bacterium]MBS1727169.1 stage II sporulation protein M [Armatimonadota bacterium]